MYETYQIVNLLLKVIFVSCECKRNILLAYCFVDVFVDVFLRIARPSKSQVWRNETDINQLSKVMFLSVYTLSSSVINRIFNLKHFLFKRLSYLIVHVHHTIIMRYHWPMYVYNYVMRACGHTQAWSMVQHRKSYFLAVV